MAGAGGCCVAGARSLACLHGYVVVAATVVPACTAPAPPAPTPSNAGKRALVHGKRALVHGKRRVSVRAVRPDRIDRVSECEKVTGFPARTRSRLRSPYVMLALFRAKTSVKIRRGLNWEMML